MNKRIQELEGQAWEQVTRTNGLVRTEDFNQKFAELIINECYNRAEGQYHHSGDDWDKGVMAVMDSIEELFRS